MDGKRRAGSHIRILIKRLLQTDRCIPSTRSVVSGQRPPLHGGLRWWDALLPRTPAANLPWKQAGRSFCSRGKTCRILALLCSGLSLPKPACTVFMPFGRGHAETNPLDCIEFGSLWWDQAHRLDHCGLLRAFFFPVFFDSTTRASRVSNPSDFKLGRNPGS